MNATERCDRCGAQAYVMTIHSGNSLLWCGHHYEEFKDLLENSVYLDERKSLTADNIKL